MSATRDQNVSAMIVAIRESAGNPGITCPICVRIASAPYRRRNAAGRIVEGCVDAFHTGRLVTQADSAWHDRPDAREMRVTTLKSLQATV